MREGQDWGWCVAIRIAHRFKPSSMSAVTINTVVVTLKNLAICWNNRVSETTQKSDNVLGAVNQQETRKIIVKC